MEWMFDVKVFIKQGLRCLYNHRHILDVLVLVDVNTIGHEDTDELWYHTSSHLIGMFTTKPIDIGTISSKLCGGVLSLPLGNWITLSVT